MKKYSSRKGDNLIEYVLVTILVGIVGGYAFTFMSPEVFRTFFKSSFGGSSSTGANVTVGPVGETDLSGITITY
jgi:hypothetical protein